LAHSVIVNQTQRHINSERSVTQASFCTIGTKSTINSVFLYLVQT